MRGTISQRCRGQRGVACCPLRTAAACRTIRTVVATFIVYDELDRCPYLAGHVARLPLRVPARPLTRAEVDAALAAGDRRQGVFLYRPSCPACQACEAIRIPVADFAPSATHRRTLRAGDARFRLEVGRPVADEQRAALYARHKWGRGLTTTDDHEETTDVETYAAFLVETCCESVEFALWDGDHLVSVAVADRGERSLSAVYCCFDPDYARFSPGTYTHPQAVAVLRRRGGSVPVPGPVRGRVGAPLVQGEFRPARAADRGGVDAVRARARSHHGAAGRWTVAARNRPRATSRTSRPAALAPQPAWSLWYTCPVVPPAPAGVRASYADVAQLVEQLIRNQQVVSSSLIVGSSLNPSPINTLQAPTRPGSTPVGA